MAVAYLCCMRSFVRPLLLTVLICAPSAHGASEETVRKSVPVTGATGLRMRVDFGSISTHPGDGKSVGVEVYFRGEPPTRAEYDRMLHDFRLDVRQEGLEIHVDGNFVHGWEPALSFIADNLFSGGNKMCREWRCLRYSSWLREVGYQITMPGQFNAELRTSGGPINIQGTHGRVLAHTSGGSIRMTDVGGDVDASTSGGSISVDGVSGRMKVHTSGGSVSASGIKGMVDASTSGGSVRAAFLAQPTGDCRFQTSGGSINLSLPSDARVNLDASTSGGRVSTDFAMPYRDRHEENQLRAPLNGGGPQLYAHTAGGGIRIRKGGSL
jgi:hypothetical protein